MCCSFTTTIFKCRPHSFICICATVYFWEKSITKLIKLTRLRKPSIKSLLIDFPIDFHLSLPHREVMREAGVSPLHKCTAVSFIRSDVIRNACVTWNPDAGIHSSKETDVLSVSQAVPRGWRALKKIKQQVCADAHFKHCSLTLLSVASQFFISVPLFFMYFSHSYCYCEDWSGRQGGVTGFFLFSFSNSRMYLPPPQNNQFTK